MNTPAKKIVPALFTFAFASTLAACGGYGSGGGYTAPGVGTGPTAPSGVGSNTIGFSMPSSAIGTVNTQFGVIGGYTQSTYSQVIAFPVGTTLTIKNLSSTAPNTLNVLSTTGFPTNPVLSTTASASTDLTTGYASGVIQPGGTATVTLTTPGTFFVGSALNYMSNPSMRGVIEVSNTATPGPQATPPSSGGGGGNIGGY